MKCCPYCGGEVRVKDTRHGEKDETYRRYVCLSCKTMIFTVEFQAEENDSFFRRWRKADRKRAEKEERGHKYDGAENIRVFDADND